jgi:hypothetical protein
MSNPEYAHVGIYFPKDTLKAIDERRGRYNSRNRFLLRIVDDFLAKGDSDNIKNE